MVKIFFVCLIEDEFSLLKLQVASIHGKSLKIACLFGKPLAKLADERGKSSVGFEHKDKQMIKETLCAMNDDVSHTSQRRIKHKEKIHN